MIHEENNTGRGSANKDTRKAMLDIPFLHTGKGFPQITPVLANHLTHPHPSLGKDKKNREFSRV